MKTKTFKLFYISLCILISFVSCNLIDLDTPSQSDYSSDNLFKTVSQARMTTLGIYYTFTHDIYSRTINTHYSTDTDEAQVQGGLNSAGRRLLSRYNATPYVGSELTKVYDRLYAGVERANTVIDRVPKMDLYENGTEAEKKELRRFYGEALALRAYFMHDLVKFWGDVPFKTTPSFSGENFFVDRVSRDTIYETIINDLLTAVELVPWRSEVSPQARFTKGAVKGMLARIALHAGGYSLRWDENRQNVGMRRNPDQNKVREYYQIARDQCWEIMQSGEHKLNPEYINIWKTLCSQSFDTSWGESMFEIGFWNPTGEQAGNGYIGNKIGVPTNKAVYAEFGNGGSEQRVLPTYYHSFNDLDVRKKVTVADFEIDDRGMRVVRNRVWEYCPGKWRTWWSTYKSASTYTGINHILLRYADVLLMFAEADSWLNNGPTTEAINALKQVRRRAYKGNESIIDAETYPTDLDGFMDVLIQERAWEFGTEGIRKWDLIRWNKLTEVINKTKIDLENFRNDENIPRYLYYLPVSDPEQENPKVFGNSSTIPADLAAQGYLRRDYRNGLTATITGYVAQGYEENKDELYPIPIQAITANPALSQHPKY